jgi:ribosomal protein S18 acetylase RimI-like enzyme
MSQIHRVRPMKSLTAADRAALEHLVAHCRQRDGCAPPLYIETPPLGSDAHICTFCCDADGAGLAGFASLTRDDPPEVYLVVHPDHRRFGIGRALLESVRSEAQRGAVASLLLVGDEALASGDAFAHAMGASYYDSEYCMEFDSDAPTPPASLGNGVHLIRAGASEADTLIRIQVASFQGAEATVRPQVEGWLTEGDAQRFYVGRRDGEPIGSLRIFLVPDESLAYINTFGILPEHQGQGYGRRMLRDVVAALREEGWRQIRIEVATDNPIALSLYRSSGFQQIAAYRYYELPV